MSTEIALSRVEAIVIELEKLDAETGGKFREPEDQEAFYIASRIERRMRRQRHSNVQTPKSPDREATCTD